MASVSLHADEPSVKISLGIRDTKLLMITNVAYPLAFRIENSGKTAIKGNHIAGIFAKGTIHILPNDGQEQHCPIGDEWILGYGLVPNDLQPRETSECSATGDVLTFFPSAKDGDYEVWWTLGDLKSNVSHFTVTSGKVSVYAADEPLIPASLNALLPKIASGMTHDDIKKVLSAAYPKLEPQDGPWSGQSGYIGFHLDEQFSVMVSAHMDTNQHAVVSTNALILVFDRAQKLRLDITHYYWDDKAPQK